MDKKPSRGLGWANKIFNTFAFHTTRRALKQGVLKKNETQPAIIAYIAHWTFESIEVLVAARFIIIQFLLPRAQRLFPNTSTANLVKICSLGVFSLEFLRHALGYLIRFGPVQGLKTLSKYSHITIQSSTLCLPDDRKFVQHQAQSTGWTAWLSNIFFYGIALEQVWTCAQLLRIEAFTAPQYIWPLRIGALLTIGLLAQLEQQQQHWLNQKYLGLIQKISHRVTIAPTQKMSPKPTNSLAKSVICAAILLAASTSTLIQQHLGIYFALIASSYIAYRAVSHYLKTPAAPAILYASRNFITTAIILHKVCDYGINCMTGWLRQRHPLKVTAFTKPATQVAAALITTITSNKAVSQYYTTLQEQRCKQISRTLEHQHTQVKLA